MVYWITMLLLAGIGVALFLLPHHKGDFEFASLARDFEEVVHEDTSDSPGIFVWILLVGLGCLGVFLPGLQAMALALVSREASRQILIIGGLLLVVAGLLTFLVEIFSNMLIGWGSGSKYPITTSVAYLAPLFPLLCGIASIVLGAMRVRLP